MENKKRERERERSDFVGFTYKTEKMEQSPLLFSIAIYLLLSLCKP